MNYHKKYNNFYQSQRWRTLRGVVFVESCGLCQRCLSRGVESEAKEVHHIEPIGKSWAKRYDRDNLILLCEECHRIAHERSSPLQEFNKFWEELDNAEGAKDKR